MMYRFLIGLILTACVAACGGSNDSGGGATTRVLDGKDYLVLNAGSLESTPTAAKGPGSFVFMAPVGEIRANKNFTVTFTIEDGGSLELISHASNKLEGGVAIRWTRSGSVLSLALAAAGTATAPKPLSGIDASQEVTMSVDVHNGESPAHVLLWKAGEGTATDDTAVFNSDADGKAPGQGTGTFWGFVLGKATLEGAEIGEARFAH